MYGASFCFVIVISKVVLKEKTRNRNETFSALKLEKTIHFLSQEFELATEADNKQY